MYKSPIGKSEIRWSYGSLVFKNFHFSSYKFLALSVAFFGLASTIQLFYPIEIVVQIVSNKVRQHNASGEFIILSIDDYAAANGFTTPIPAKDAKDIFSSLNEAGVKSVVFTEPVLSGSYDETSSLKSLLDANRDKFYIAQPWLNTDERGLLDLQKYISSHISIHNTKRVMYWGGVDTTTYTKMIHGQNLVSAESVLTGIYGRVGEKFMIDYATDPHSLPLIHYSPSEVSNLSAGIHGKNVIVGYETSNKARSVIVLGHKGRYGLPTTIALGAETLHAGKPFHIGWIWSLCLSIILSWYILGTRGLFRQSLAGGLGVLGLFMTLIALNSFSITASISGAVALLIFVTIAAMRQTLKEQAAKRKAVHPESGLPSVNALRLEGFKDQPLITAQMAQFDELMGLLSPQDRKVFAHRIRALATMSEAIWHGEDGHFYWFADADQSATITEHLESLSLIFRNGFSIADLPISLQTVFGVDMRYDTAMANRILGANLAAKEAVTQGSVWNIYQEANKDDTAWSITRLHELDTAINEGQIKAALQPKVCLHTGQITGAEALARWTHPVRGAVSPEEFVAAAEKGGRIRDLTMAVMKSAFESIEAGLGHNADFKIAINITPSLLVDKTLISSLSSLMAQYQIAPHNLILEVTESTVFSDDEECIHYMNALVDMGVTLSIDDYGTGNSTLEYLRKIPAGELKIDRNFIRNIIANESDRKLVKSTIKLAQELGMSVVAEGVEDSLTLEKLRMMGCDMVQGYLISKPLNDNDFRVFMGYLKRDLNIATK